MIDHHNFLNIDPICDVLLTPLLKIMNLKFSTSYRPNLKRNLSKSVNFDKILAR